MIYIVPKNRRVSETFEYSKQKNLPDSAQAKLVELLSEHKVTKLSSQNFAACLDLDELQNCELDLLTNEEKDRRRKLYKKLSRCLDGICSVDTGAIGCIESVLANQMWNNLIADPRIPDLPEIPGGTPYLRGALKQVLKKAIEETTRQNGLMEIPKNPNTCSRMWAIHRIEDAWRYYVPLRPATTGGEKASAFHKAVKLIIAELDQIEGKADYKSDIEASRKIDWSNLHIRTSHFLDKKPFIINEKESKK